VSPDDRDPLQNDDRLLRRSLTPTGVAAGPCLDAETLAAWAEGSPGVERTDALERHLASCARCQAMLATFANAELAEGVYAAGAPSSDSQSKVLPFKPAFPRWAPIALGAVAASLVIYAAWPRHARSESQPPQQTMASATPAGQVQYPADVRATDQLSPAVAKTAEMAAARQPQKKAAAKSSRQTPAASTPAPVAPPEPFRAPPVVVPPTGAAIAGVTLPPPPPPVVAPPSAAAKPGELTMLRGANDAARTDASASRIVADFASPTTTTPAAGQSLIGRGAGGGGRGGGAGALIASPRPIARVNWHVLASGQVERSINGGQTWQPVTITPPAIMVNGTAPSSDVCWLIGKGGIVMLSTNGVTFRRVHSPDVADLHSITAIDEFQATVTTIDGRVFTTDDGGDHWK